MKRKELNSTVNRLVSSTDPDEVKRLYKEWATSYDADLDSFGYAAPRIGVQLLSQQLSNKQSLIHDAGCGTGLVGSLLYGLGFTQLHGSDFSPAMLERAEATGHYTHLQSLDFSRPIDVVSNTYAAVISIGVYTKRFERVFIEEMLRIVQPSGHFVFSCRELYFEEVMFSISALLKSKTIAHASVQFDDYMTGQGASAYYFDLRKASI